MLQAEIIPAGKTYLTATMLLSAADMPAHSRWSGEPDFSNIYFNEVTDIPTPALFSQVTRFELDAVDGLIVRRIEMNYLVEEKARHNVTRRIFFEIENVTDEPISFTDKRLEIGGFAAAVGFTSPREDIPDLASTPDTPFTITDIDGAPKDAAWTDITFALTDSGATAGAYGDNLSTLLATVNTQGLITALASTGVQGHVHAVNAIGHGFAAFKSLKSTGSETYGLASNDSLANAAVVGMVVPNHITADAYNMLGPGSYISGMSGLTPNTLYYLAASGGYTATVPTTGQVCKPLFHALSATTAVFLNETAYVVGALATDADLDAETAARIAADAGKAALSHTHVAADVTNLNEAVQDMIGSFFVAGTGVSLNYDDTANTFTITNSAPLTTEQVQDIVGAMVANGANVTATYDDTAGTLTIASAGSSTITTEDVQDIVAALLLQGTNVTLTYNDAANTLTVTAASPGDGSQSANTVKAGPTSGGSATAAYRALVNADIPLYQRVGEVALTDASTVAIDLSLGNTFVLSTAAARTMGIPTNFLAGQRFIIAIKNTDSSAHTPTFTVSGTNCFAYGTDVTTAGAIAAGTTTEYACRCDGTSGKVRILGISAGY